MFYLTNLNKITDTKYNAQFIYPKTLEELKTILNKTEEQLNADGVFVDALPKKEKLDDYYSMLYVNPKDKTVWYEYIKKVDIPNLEDLQNTVNSLNDQLLQVQEYTVDAAYNNLIGGVN